MRPKYWPQILIFGQLREILCGRNFSLSGPSANRFLIFRSKTLFCPIGDLFLVLNLVKFLTLSSNSDDWNFSNSNVFIKLTNKILHLSSPHENFIMKYKTRLTRFKNAFKQIPKNNLKKSLVRQQVKALLVTSNRNGVIFKLNQIVHKLIESKKFCRPKEIVGNLIKLTDSLRNF